MHATLWPKSACFPPTVAAILVRVQLLFLCTPYNIVCATPLPPWPAMVPPAWAPRPREDLPTLPPGTPPARAPRPREVLGPPGSPPARALRPREDLLRPGPGPSAAASLVLTGSGD